MIGLALLTTTVNADNALPTCADELEACTVVMRQQEEYIDMQEKQLQIYATELKKARAKSEPWISPTTAILLGVIVGFTVQEIIR